MVIQYVWEWIAMVKIGFIVEGNTEKIDKKLANLMFTNRFLADIIYTM